MAPIIHRLTHAFGLQIQRARNPYVELHRLLGDKRPVRNVLDGGALYGGHTTQFLELWPECTVHAFEPQSDTFAKLQSKFPHEPRVRLYQRALSDRVGEAEFHINEQNYTSSLLTTAEPSTMRPRRTEKVAVTTIDAWLVEEQLSPPDVVKLDLQGFELAALRGAEQSLAAGVAGLIVEINFYRRYDNSCLFGDVAAFLENRGFRIFRLYEIMNSPSGGWQQADVLFVHRDLLGTARGR